MSSEENTWKEELRNLENITRHIKPTRGDIPNLNGIDIFGQIIPLKKVAGGDHITFLNFNNRYNIEKLIRKATDEQVRKNLRACQTKGAIMLVDVSGHESTDAAIAGQVHSAFRMGSRYEMKINGEITKELFEYLNTQFVDQTSSDKFITMIYGEISENGSFRYISAGHEPLIHFSAKKNRIIKNKKAYLLNSLPLGISPSKNSVDADKNENSMGYKDEYKVRELKLVNPNDMIILYTDGLSDHSKKYFKTGLQKRLKESKNLSAEDISNKIKEDIFEIGTQKDDISYVIIKKE